MFEIWNLAVSTLLPKYVEWLGEWCFVLIFRLTSKVFLRQLDMVKVKFVNIMISIPLFERSVWKAYIVSIWKIKADIAN